MHIKSTWSYINKGLLIILSFLVVSTFASIFYLTRTLTSLRQATEANGNSVGTVFVLQDLLIHLQDVQTSVRGYVITGDPKFKEPYNRALADIPADVKIFKTNPDLLLSDRQIAELERLTNHKLDVMRQTMAIRDNEGLEAAQAFVATSQGEEILQEIRTDITDLSSRSLQNIGPMQRDSENKTRLALAVAGATGLFVFGTCIAVIWYFRRTILHERALESTKNEFLSLASHQLRTPATNVKQYLGMLLDGYMGDLSDQQRKALHVAYKNNESEINIMNNLLDVAKLDLERIQLHKTVVNIMKITRNVVRDLGPTAKEKQQTIKLKGEKQVMAFVDEQYIKGVIENLVDNAIKYSREGTIITISIDRIEDNVCIAVKDKGVGIRKRDYSKLFNKFSRLTNEFSANSEGSGLGLYWVKQIVSLHGGKIEVLSREGKGSIFTVKLPVR
jgi:signal transduction histidine kinase